MEEVWYKSTPKAKIKFCKVVLTTLRHTCETWTIYRRHERLSCLRKLLRIRWQGKIPDTSVLSKADMLSIYTLMGKAQIIWTGHVHRKPNAQQLFCRELIHGKWSVGGQEENALLWRQSERFTKWLLHQLQPMARFSWTASQVVRSYLRRRRISGEATIAIRGKKTGTTRGPRFQQVSLPSLR